MFSQSLRRFGHLLNRENKRIALRNCSVNRTTSAVNEDIVSIALTGQVKNIAEQQNGSLTLYLRSTVPGNYSISHKIVVPHQSGKLLNILKTNLGLEQKVYVEGIISTQKFETADRKHRSTSTILANEMDVISDAGVSDGSIEKAEGEAETTRCAIDLNSVEILGRVNTSVVGNDFKSFTISSLKNSRNETTFSFNRIFVYDSALFPLLESIKVKQDKVLVRGTICYRKETDTFGKHKASSYINASQIYRL